MKCYHIHIEGRVQGVGFRPFIYNLAKNQNLRGTVSNTMDGVHIFLNIGDEKIVQFEELIRREAPPQSIITSIRHIEIPNRTFNDFTIIESHLQGTPDLLITPDFAICDQCSEELNDPDNRRYQYPYLTCTKCGPRFSIEEELPYDRSRTSMKSFQVCDDCETEYHNPMDIRFYSQTNSCPDCKISQWIVDKNRKQINLKEEEMVNFICDKILSGKIVAIKGIGGFLLMCDAQNSENVKELRKKKHRPTKPFALMYPNEAFVLKNLKISRDELSELKSAQSPILLLKNIDGKKIDSMQQLIAPKLNRLGVMLPYAPLLVLILQKLNRPLLATSGNFKGSPIIFENQKAIESLNLFVDYFLLNNRRIQVPQDDSVVRFTDTHGQKIMIRRSRGYAPGFLQESIDPLFDEKVLSMGALLKSTFSIWQKGRCHISQFLGDTTELDAQICYDRAVRHFMNLLQFKPEIIIVDKHPAYFTTLFGRELAAIHDTGLFQVQHHEAHFWAVLGEHNLLTNDEKILGVVFDGTGMGNDGAIWGGEFFSFDNGKVKRISHLSYYPHILGDKMSREPRLSAMAIMNSFGLEYHLIEAQFTEQEIELYTKVLERSTLKTSSVGRLFDAVSSLLGLCHINTYEGEAAMYLECLARKYADQHGLNIDGYGFKITEKGVVDFNPLLTAIIKDINAGENHGLIAVRFHTTLVQLIETIADFSKINTIAMSGGVFQNGLLVDMVIERLGNNYKLYFHNELSPNDECVSYGQLVAYYAHTENKRTEKIISKFNSILE